MSESDQFRQYAEEAMLWLVHSADEKQLLLELCTWTGAAVVADTIAIPERPQHVGRSPHRPGRTAGDAAEPHEGGQERPEPVSVCVTVRGDEPRPARRTASPPFGVLAKRQS